MNKNNFYLYFARFCRHYVLTNDWKDILTFFDLTHSFRFLIDIKGEIDAVLAEENYECKFRYISNLKQIKDNSLDGITMFDTIKTNSGSHSHMGFINRALSKEELDNYHPVMPIYNTRIMTFTDWLGSELGLIKENDVSFVINRETFIKRISNEFSGSHPYESNDYQEKNQRKQFINSFIDKVHGMVISNYHYGYLLIQQLAEDLISAVIDYLLLDDINSGNNIFIKCKDIIEHKKELK